MYCDGGYWNYLCCWRCTKTKLVKSDLQETLGGKNGLTIVWADKDNAYLQLAAKYVRSTLHWSQVQVKYFSEQNKLSEWAELAIHADILLVHEHWLPPSDKLEHVDCVVVIAEQASVGNGQYAAVVSKFQSLDKLLEQVLTIYQNNKAACTVTCEISKGLPLGKVISICSTTGGCGKTIVAMNLAKILSASGHNVFYLSLESYTASQFWFASRNTDDSQGLSKVLYYLQTNQEQLENTIRKATQQDELTGIHYFGPISYMRDIQELTEEHTTCLIKALQELHYYDYIMVDLEAWSNSRSHAVLKESAHMIWVLLDDASYMCKTKQLLHEWELKEPQGYEQLRVKTQFLLNKHTGTVHNDVVSRGIYISTYTPYIPQWKSVQHREQILNQRIFEEPLLQLDFGSKGRQ